ncbi:hypothetical protein KIW84_015330 [Lathyrus oleraceus]|uniref:Uncharacterized protein n=1 Tax=Pisum sativum TaxID=3888 RepID=A0A9D5BQM6_PEA|nr:hypothetical protein KIW84_015330 [Pisum sativum]
MADDIEDSHILTDRVIPIGSCRWRLGEQSHAPRTLQHRRGRVEWGIYFDVKPFVVIVNDVKTTTQDDTKTRVKTHTDTNVEAQANIEVVIKVEAEVEDQAKTKLNHFIAEYHKLQNDKPMKGSFQKDSIKKKFKKILMATWDELDNEKDFEEYEKQANLALMALTSSEADSNSDFGSKSEE